MMMLCDTHCHLSDRAFAQDVDAVVERAVGAGVSRIVVPGYDAATNEGALELAGRHESIAPAVGFHPHDAKDVTEAMFRELAGQAGRAEVVAVGEIGLDHYRDLSPHDVQLRVLERQLEIAIDAGKPVSVHSRGAEAAIEAPLAAYAAHSPLRGERPVGVMHCFGGTVQQALRYIGLGFSISIPCTITYRSGEETRRLARELPLASLVVETDSPYLPPQEWRGKRNEPAYVVKAVESIAHERGDAVDVVAQATYENACRLFGLPIEVNVC